MKVSEIEKHKIALEYEDWHAYQLEHYSPTPGRTVYVVHTDNGLIGLGEGRDEEQEIIDQYLGSNPFDWIGDETSLSLGTAMYDLMGQAAGVPVYKLFGQKYRSWVPMGSWTVSTHPTRMAEAVQRFAARGYTWLKYHLSPFENVIYQTEAMQEVAPEGFKIHYDLTGVTTDNHIPDLINQLARFPVAGCIEDALDAGDIQASIELRRRSKLPIVRHQAPLEATFEVMMGAADAYIRGHQKIGVVMRQAGLFAAGNIPFMIQNVGGTITRAMVLHMMAAFPTATFHAHNDAEVWKHDVVEERLEPINGFVRVPEKPGLGVTLDRDELERLERLERPQAPQWIIKTRFKNGAKLYSIFHGGHFLVRPTLDRQIPMRYDSPLETEYWDDDGSPEYQEMFARLERERLVLEK
jgi:gluconate/galactonate dehydratase